MNKDVVLGRETRGHVDEIDVEDIFISLDPAMYRRVREQYLFFRKLAECHLSAWPSMS